MVSLNDLDAQLAELEQGSEEEDDGSSEADNENQHSTGSSKGSDKNDTDAFLRKWKEKRAEKKSAMLDDEGKKDSKKQDKKRKESELNLESAPDPSKKRKDKAARDAICFRYLAGTCKFDDCKFMHVNPRKLSKEETAQILKDLPWKTFDQKLAEVIRSLNIPKCKDFGNPKRGGCKHEGKCHFWHLTDAHIAKWAGFDFWCEPCSKAFTSEDQMLEHRKGKLHIQRAGKEDDWQNGSWNSSSDGADWTEQPSKRQRGRGGSHGRGGGRGRGHVSSSDEEEVVVGLRARGRGRGGGRRG